MTERRIRNVSIVFLFFAAHFSEAQHIESFGVFGGINFPFTIDQGLHKDPRYVGKLTLRGTPVGVSYGYDRVGHGFVITPSFVQIGQKYIIQNIQGGDVGERDIQMNYLSVPMALKLHLNDLAFFRLSAVASLNIDYLMSGKEIITHGASKQRYPPGVIIPDEPGYTSVYDGVFVPEVNKQVYVDKSAFKPFQLSAGIGFRSDFDFSEDWSVNFDGRAMFGIFDPRKGSYVNDLKAGSTSNPGPDLYGQRRDVYLYATVGISRIFQIKQEHKPKTSRRPAGASKPLGRKKPKNN
ncbi:MAG TPA: outer membrane beta-barrel protein [Cyclobacteriaceae bacterium]|nr:outer membrane beta-barrel protein [Cyclobacteriaceae bacterium]